MLAPERAPELLRAFLKPDWLEQRLADVAHLPKACGEIARTLLEASREPQRDCSTRSQGDLERIGECLDELGPGERLQIFAALFPRTAGQVEYAWRLHHTLPCLSDQPPRPFRTRPEDTRRACARWLVALLQAVTGLEEDVAWLAAWAPYLPAPGAASALGILFAAAIDMGDRQGEVVFQELVASALGEHAIGCWGPHVARGLLMAARPEGWDVVERLLLGGRRAADGVPPSRRTDSRRAILATMGEAHPQALRRLLRLIREHNLGRFGLVARALDGIVSWGWRSADLSELNEGLERALRLLDDPATRHAVLYTGSGQEAYLALWALACEDADDAAEAATGLLADHSVERRFAAVHLLAQLGLPEAHEALLQALDDADLRVAARAVAALRHSAQVGLPQSDLFERLERAIPRLPEERQALEPIIWPRLRWVADREMAGNLLLQALDSRPPARLIPNLSAMSAHGRIRAAQQLAQMPAGYAARQALISMLDDPSHQVRQCALQAMARPQLIEADAIHLEKLLATSRGDVRRGLLGLLLSQPDRRALASARRLMATPDQALRLAGLELLRRLAENRRDQLACRALARQHRDRRSPLTEGEEELLSVILDAEAGTLSLADALGLAPPDQRTPVVPPKAVQGFPPGGRKATLLTPAAIGCLTSLDDLIASQDVGDAAGAKALGPPDAHGSPGALLFPLPAPGVPAEDDAARLPLVALWQAWWSERPEGLRDDDGLELIRALGRLMALRPAGPLDPPWLREIFPALYGPPTPPLRYPQLVEPILAWLIRLHPAPGATDFLLDALEYTLARVPGKAVARLASGQEADDWRGNPGLLAWLELARRHRGWCSEQWANQHQVRLWRLLRWLDEPGPRAPRCRPQLAELLGALRVGQANEADLCDQLLGTRLADAGDSAPFGDLASLSGRKLSLLFYIYPMLREVVGRCRERLLEAEIDRGELATAASEPALALVYAGGLSVLARLLRSLARTNLARGTACDRRSRASVLSHLVRATYPSETDTAEDLAAQLLAAGVPRRKRIRLALFAPQWADHVERAVGWPGLADAAWWFHAHALGGGPAVAQLQQEPIPGAPGWAADEGIREYWGMEIRKRASRPAEEILAGAVDVVWFQRCSAALPGEQWAEVYRAAAYTGWGSRYRRARLFADAIQGRVTRTFLLDRITRKRDPDAVQALGLLPLAPVQERQADLTLRWRAINRFERRSSRLPPTPRAAAGSAATMALESLALMAGYQDAAQLAQVLGGPPQGP